MAFVNSKLGNGFRIKVADSSKDQEHYFSGAKKHISMLAIGSLTGSLDRQFVSGAFGSGSEHSWRFLDAIDDNQGNLYVCGTKLTGSDAVVDTTWTVWRSQDDGDTWAEVLERPGAAGGVWADQSHKVAYRMAAKSDGTVFVAGNWDGGEFSAGVLTWQVFSSSAGDAGTWGMVYEVEGQIITEMSGGIAIEVNPENDDEIVVVHSISGSAAQLVTSSLGGTSASFLVANTATVFGVTPLPYALGISGSKVFVGFGNSYQSISAIITGTLGVDLFEDTVYSETLAGGGINNIKRFLFEGGGKVWAVGERKTNSNVLTSSNYGHDATWGHNEAVRDGILKTGTANSHVTDIIKDDDGYIWVTAIQRETASESGSSVIAWNSASEAGSWTFMERGSVQSYATVLSPQYRNLIVVGQSGSLSASKFATIDRGYPVSMRNQGSETVTVSPNSELLYGLTFKDANTTSSFGGKDKNAEYFTGLGGGSDPHRIEALSSLSEVDISLHISGTSPLDAVFLSQSVSEISVAAFALSGTVEVSRSYQDLTTGSFSVLQTNGQIQFSTNPLSPPAIPTEIAFLRVKVTGTVDITLSAFELRYLQQLTDDGVRFFKEVENQNLEFVNLNLKTLKGVED